MNSGALLIGYHGCDRDVGRQVLDGEVELRASTNDYDWLGEGAYFWENDPWRALEWAQRVHGSRAFVIGAVIQPMNCLDLLQVDSVRLVKDAYDELRDTYDVFRLNLPENKTIDGELVVRRLDCAVIQYLHQMRKESGMSPFDVVRGVFPEGRELYPKAGFLDRSHIQLCVRDPKAVIGYFRARALLR